jgi:hypothetical protein
MNSKPRKTSPATFDNVASMADDESEIPELIRLRGGGVAWYEKELPPLKQLDKMFRDLREVGHALDADETNEALNDHFHSKLIQLDGLLSDESLSPLELDDEVRGWAREQRQEAWEWWNVLPIQRKRRLDELS